MLSALLICAIQPLQSRAQASPSYLGFDRNNYPGDQNLKALRQTFSFAGYWLNRPPSARVNTWAGKRAKLQSAGFGFLVLFNGRLYADLKTVSRAVALGKSDARAAALAAHREGFPGDTIIFLDQEQGGRMLPEQKAYIYAWVDGVSAAGFRAGIYCSGIAAEEDHGHEHRHRERYSPECRAGARLFISSPTTPVHRRRGACFRKSRRARRKVESDFADVWQFAQSPRREDVSAGCPATHNPDGNCYPPGVDVGQRLHVDVETATSADPSQGRSR